MDADVVARKEGRQSTVKPRVILLAAFTFGATALATGCSVNSTNSTGVSNGTSAKKITVSGPQTGASFHTNATLTSSWLKTDVSKQQVTIDLTTPVNNLSLNGYSNGYANIVVPVNWKVTVNYTNKNQVVREGLAVVKHSDVIKGTQAKVAFTGAQTPDYLHGAPPSTMQTFTFTPAQTGKYVIEAVQTGQSGTWLWFTVSSAATQPSVQTK
jgi:hypothetical protein